MKGRAPGVFLEGNNLIILGLTLLVNILVLESINRSVGPLLTVLFTFHARAMTQIY